MKKLLAMLFVLIAGFCAARAEDFPALVFSNQVITVQYSQLALDTVRYAQEEVVTNTVREWVETTEITTNELHAGLGDYVVSTNDVTLQVATETIVTNAAAWRTSVKFNLPRGYQWALNGIPVTIDRFSTTLEIDLAPAEVEAVFGSSYEGLRFAATTGNYQPTGQVRDGFLSLAAQVIASGAARP